MKTMMFMLLTLFIWGVMASAQSTDPQMRLSFHPAIAAPENRIGLACWVIVPDTTADPVRTLIVGGLLFKAHGLRQKVNRLELMTGGMADKNGFHAVFDERSFTGFLGLDFFQEFLYMLPASQSMLEESLTRKFRVKKLRFAGGAESNVFTSGPFLAPHRTPLGGVGPRIAVPLTTFLTISANYQFRNRNGNMFRFQITLAP